MAGNRTLKLSILADVDNLKKNLDSGSKDVSTFGDKIGKFGKIAGAAFAAAGIAAAAYAGKLAIDGVKAAIEDEAAQAKLATTLQNVTGATDDQIAAVEDYILKQSLLFGVTDDELRPSLDRLTRATGDVTKAQKLQAIAIDISAGTGKTLQAVTEALSKAQEGNLAGLSRLGVGLSKAELATLTFDQVTAKLAATFEGQATKQADTFQGKMARLSIAFNEAKETVGAFILDAITPIVEVIVEKVVPAVQSFIDGMGGKEGLGETFKQVSDFAKKFFTPIIEALKGAFDKIKKAVMDNKDEFQALFEFLKKFVAPFLSGVLSLAIQGIGTAISVVINFVGKLIAGFEKLIQLGGKVKDILGFGSSPAGTSSIPGSSNIPGGFSPIGASSIPNRSQAPVSITINGAIDPISTARQIAQILNTEATLSGTFSNLGGSRLVSSV